MECVFLICNGFNIIGIYGDSIVALPEQEEDTICNLEQIGVELPLSIPRHMGTERLDRQETLPST